MSIDTTLGKDFLSNLMGAVRNINTLTQATIIAASIILDRATTSFQAVINIISNANPLLQFLL